MANYLVSDTDLTSVADAIRTKGGTSAQLAFPAGFVSAVEAIETGGGGGDLLDYSWPSGEYENDIYVDQTHNFDTGIPSHAFAYRTGLTKVRLPNITRTHWAGAFLKDEANVAATFIGCTNLVEVDFPELTSAYRADRLFYGCTRLTTINWPKCTLFGGMDYAFYGCTALQVIAFPGQSGTSFQGIGGYEFGNCTSLSIADFPVAGSIGANAFNGATVFATLIIRASSVQTLSNINAFVGTPFASGGSGGTLYVPSALVSQYTQATNWSTILGYTNNQILPIEGSIYETQYADGTPIT